MNRIWMVFALIVIMASACTIDPCLTKGQFLNAYNNFTDKVSDAHEDFSKQEWEEKDEEMDHFVDQCYQKYEDKLSDEEKKDFWIKYFKYKYDRHGRSVLRAIEADMREFGLEIDEELDQLFDNPEEDLKDIFREVYGDDIEKALDDFKRGIEDISEKIKAWLEENK